MNETKIATEVEAAYEAPQIESVITPEELEREVAYAGFVAISGAK